MLIASDAGCDDDRRCNSELLAREINRLDSLDAFELIDGERVAIHTAATVLERVRQPALLHCQFDEGQTYLRSVILESLREAAREITPDMSLRWCPVSALLARLRAKVGRMHPSVQSVKAGAIAHPGKRAQLTSGS